MERPATSRTQCIDFFSNPRLNLGRCLLLVSVLVLLSGGTLAQMRGQRTWFEFQHKAPKYPVKIDPARSASKDLSAGAGAAHDQRVFSVTSVVGAGANMADGNSVQSSAYNIGPQPNSDDGDNLFVSRGAANNSLEKLLSFLSPAAPFAPPNLTLTGTCDTFGNSVFTIKNLGGAMTTNYTWEIYQNNVFLTSGVFQLTAAGTSSDTQQLTINGLYGNIAVAIKNGTTPAAVEITRVTAFCVERPTVTVKQAAGESDPTTIIPIRFDVAFSKVVTGFTNTDVHIVGMVATPGITVTDSGDHKNYSVAITGMADGETVNATIPQDAAQDADGNGNRISTYLSTDHSVTYHAPPNLTLSGTCDIFGNSVFTIKNIGGAMTTNYTWEIYQNNVFLTSGTFQLTKAGTPSDTQQLTINGLYGNIAVAIKNGTTPAAVQIAITSAICVNSSPTVTINQASTQSDPTNASPIKFDVIFNTAVSGFTNSDVNISGMAATPVKTVTDSGDHIHFSVTVTGMADGETVTATIPAGAAFYVGHLDVQSKDSTSTDNKVAYDTSKPTVTVNQAATQADPTEISPIHFDVVFSEVITGFVSSDIDVTGTHNAAGVTLTDSGDHMHFSVAVTGMVNGDKVSAKIVAGKVSDLAGNTNTNATFADNAVTFADTTPPAVTVEQKLGQPDPVNTGPIHFIATFSEPIDAASFSNGDISLGGTAGATAALVTEIAPHDHTTFDISVSGMTVTGTVTASIAANRLRDVNGNLNIASTSTDNTVSYDITRPSVTIEQAAGQADPANNTPINFAVVFSKPVTNFDAPGDVTLSGTAGATTIHITGGPMIYNVAVSGMANDGTVIANIPANAAKDAANNLSTASTSTDNTVTFQFCGSNPIVTSNADGGSNTLRETISKICAAPNNNITFNLGPGGNTILLTGGQLEIQRDVNITNTVNAANGPLTIDGNNTNRVFMNDAGVTTTIKGVTITNGNNNNLPNPGGSGSGIRNDGTLSLSNVVIDGNHTAAQGDGGGIYNDGTLTITGSTISNNLGAAGSFGGGIESAGGSVSMTNCTVTGNTGADQGGGIRNSVGTFTITSSTIARNSAVNGGGIYNASGVLNLRNTIIALNTAIGSGPDAFGPVLSQGFNLIGDSTGATITPTIGDQVGTAAGQINPLLDVLGDYGGLTQTLRLLTGSPAIDQGESSGSLFDQRGLLRPVNYSSITNAGDGADIGAYEAQLAPIITPGGATTFCTGGGVTLTSSTPNGNQWFVNGNPIAGETNPTYIATASNDYTVEANNVFSAITTVTVNPFPTTPTITAGSATTFCAGGSVTLTSSSAAGNQWYLDGNPIGGATNQTYIATGFGDYTVIATPSGCASAVSTPTTVTVNPIPATPTITPLGPTTFCDDGNVTLSSSSADGNQWYLNGASIGGATDQVFVATAAGNYTVVATNGCTSVPSAPIAVTVNSTPAAPTITPGGPTSFCAGGSVTLNSNNASGNQWYLDGNPISGATNQSYIATATGTYTDTMTASVCPSDSSAPISVTSSPLPSTPSITPQGPTTFGAGGSVTLTSNSAAGNQWYLNSNPIAGGINQNYIATDAGDYTVVVTTTGCGSAPSAPTAVTLLHDTTYADPAGSCAGDTPCFTSIQAAIDALPNGGVVNVIGGAFNEDVNLNKPTALNINGNTSINSLTISAGTLNGSSFTLTLLSGDWTNNGGTFNPGTGEVSFNGTGQDIGGTSPTTFNNLTINSGGTILNNPNVGQESNGPSDISSDATVNGLLTLDGDLTVTSPAKLIMTSTATSAGSGDVVGNLQRLGFVSAPCAVAPCVNTLSLGNPNNQITITAGTAPTDILINLTKSAPATFASAVKRNYTITQTGGSDFTATLRLHYLDSELNGNNETGLNLRRFNGSWQSVLPSIVDTDNNWVECNAVTDFSQWAFASLAPTASTGIISGRIVRDDGNPIEGVVVRLSGTQSRKTITDANGNYSFADVETTGFYTLTPTRANYGFSPFNRSLSQLGARTEAIFSASFTGDSSNPLDTPEYFVRQQYVDVLGREPDEAGLNYWSDQILACLSEPPARRGPQSGSAIGVVDAGGSAADCTRAQRVGVAAAFFISVENQESGLYLYDVYASALGRRPVLGEFTTDRSRVAGGTTLDAAKTTFAQNFVQRTEFTARYPGTMTAEAFVDALLQSAASSGASLNDARANLISIYNQAGGDLIASRAAVMRSLADHEAFKQSQDNQAFVLTEYFAYLHRDIDPGGYDFWVNVLNSGDRRNYRGMVCSFITATEYQRRFSAVVSHSNGECGN
jgi:hypothetical protein